MKITYILVIFFIAFITSSVEVDSYQILEKSLAPVLGACLGGVLACTSIIISVLSASSKQTKSKAKESSSFISFVSNLEKDVKLLVICLFSVIFLPYLRSLHYPLEINIFDIDSNYLKQKMFSTLEVFTSVIAFLIIFELITVLITILKDMMNIHDTEI